jgi:hypothetical protein
VHQLFIDFKKACVSIRREVFYNNFIQPVIAMELVRLIRMCLKTIAQSLSDIFPIKNGLKLGDVLSSLLFNFSLEYAIKGVRVNPESLKFSGTRQLLQCVRKVAVHLGYGT